jgi:hypothetical protein
MINNNILFSLVLPNNIYYFKWSYDDKIYDLITIIKKKKN